MQGEAVRWRAAAIIAGVVLLLTATPALATGPGVISGSVSPVSVAPEVEVCVVEVRPSELCTAPEASGDYRLTGVPVGPQRVEFIPSHRSGYLVQYFDRKSRLDEATPLQIKPPPEQTVEHVDAELELGSTIAGTVGRPGGAPLGEVEVCVQGAGTGFTVACSITGVSGTYTVAGLPAGVYKIGFWGHGKSARYAPQYFDGEETFNEATAITVPPASSLTGIDAELALGAQVEGRVTVASSGATPAGIPVCLFAAGAMAPSQCVFSEGDGTYALLGIRPGAYQVGFSLGAGELGSEPDVAYLPQYYDGVATRSAAETLLLGQGQIEAGIDAALLSQPPVVPSAPPLLVPAPLSTPVPIISEPAKPKAKVCRRVIGKKAAGSKRRCVSKQKPKRHRKRHQSHPPPSGSRTGT